MAHVLSKACLLMAGGCLAACGGDSGTEQRSLELPARLETAHVTDQVVVNGQSLVVWDDGGGCRLQVGRSAPEVWLKPMAPCFFLKSPGTDTVQVYRHDKATAVVAVLGTPAKGNRCGQEVQGLRVRADGVTVSSYVMQGSVHCADQGLHNYQYSLFAR